MGFESIDWKYFLLLFTCKLQEKLELWGFAVWSGQLLITGCTVHAADHIHLLPVRRPRGSQERVKQNKNMRVS